MSSVHTLCPVMFSLCVRKLLLEAAGAGTGSVVCCGRAGCGEAGVVIQQTSNIDRCYINEDQFDRVSVIHHPAALLPAATRSTSPLPATSQASHNTETYSPGENKINTIGCLK